MSAEATNPAASPVNDGWTAIRNQLRSRAKRARGMSWGVLGFLVLWLGVGGWGFYYAATIAGHEIRTFDDRSQYSIDMGSDGEIISGGVGDVFPLESKTPKKNAEFEALKTKINKVETRIAETESSVSKTNERIDSLESGVEKVKQETNSLRKEVSSGAPRLEFLVTAFALRFGIAAVVLLLVKILTSIYRYHTRLAAHYDSKADALELCPSGDIAAFEKLCLALTPSGVDFQESADSIAEHAVEIAKKVMPAHS